MEYSIVVDSKGKEQVECDLCGTLISLGPHRNTSSFSRHRSSKDMRNHVGKHILLAHRGLSQSSMLKPGTKVIHLILDLLSKFTKHICQDWS